MERRRAERESLMDAAGTAGRAIYPFTALVGQPEMKLALILNAVNPRLGGVLIRGEKGTAKSTAARGLAALLPPLYVVDGCRFACDPTPLAARCPDCLAREAGGEVPLRPCQRPASFVDLPLGATEDRVLGTLDLERAIKEGERHFEPGLLAQANRGVLYVDEVNLLPDHLVDALLDAAAMGTNTVQREGLSLSHPAAFVLIGTMNPEEGDLRPQLLDRFALAVDVAGMPEPAERADVVRRRITFETDAAGFARRWHGAEQAEGLRIAMARERLPRVRVDDHLLELIARICTEFEVDGLRADIVIYKAAATLAAYAGRERATADDIRRAAELALPHRRRRQPFDQPGLDRQHLEQVVSQHQDPRGGDEESPEPPGQDRKPGDDHGAGPGLGPARPCSGHGSADRKPAPQEPEPDHVYEVGTGPAILAPTPSPSGVDQRAAGAESRRRPRRPSRPIESPSGRHFRSVAAEPGHPRPLDVPATLRVAAPHQRRRRDDAGSTRPGPLRIEHEDVRVKLRENPAGTCTLLVVDASGSMAARHRMAAAKGAVLSLLLDAYQKRDQVGLIAFRRSAAELLLPPTNNVDLAYARLREMPTGGRTPLAEGLRLAQATFARHRTAAGRGTTAPLVVLVSDGRANVANGANPHQAALVAARALKVFGARALVVDTEDGPVRLGLARRLCQELGGQYIHLSDLSTAASHPSARHPLAAAIQQVRSGHAGA